MKKSFFSFKTVNNVRFIAFRNGMTNCGMEFRKENIFNALFDEKTAIPKGCIFSIIYKTVSSSAYVFSVSNTRTFNALTLAGNFIDLILLRR